MERNRKALSEYIFSGLKTSLKKIISGVDIEVRWIINIGKAKLPKNLSHLLSFVNKNKLGIPKKRKNKYPHLIDVCVTGEFC